MQPKINALKKIVFQFIKGYSPSSDSERVSSSQSLLNAFIGSSDTIVDSTMPTTLLGSTLDWSAGSAKDAIVEISYNNISVEQDLTQTNEYVPSSSDVYDQAMTLVQDINRESVPDSGYTWVNVDTALDDALVLAQNING